MSKHNWFSRFFNIKKFKDNDIKKINQYIYDYENINLNSLKKIFEENDDLLLNVALLSLISKEILGIKPYKNQLLSILYILDNKFINMNTGEGKSLVAVFSAILASKKLSQISIVTTNEYLSNRDNDFYSPLLDFLNISHSFVSEKDDIQTKVKKYQNNIIFNTNSNIVFDYLKNNIIDKKEEILNIRFDFVIIDEADSILIDEANTPLIISDEYSIDTWKILKSFEIAKDLKINVNSMVDFKERKITLDNDIYSEIEHLLKIDNLFSDENIIYLENILQCLKAIYIFKKNQDYIIKDNEVLLIDINNGRILPNTKYSLGLQQALEIKEGIEVKNDNVKLISINYHEFFNLFKNISGMSGTIISEKKEILELYSRKTVVIPPHLPKKIIKKRDKVFKNYQDKIEYLITKVKLIHATKQPILIGTLNIEQSEEIYRLLLQEELPVSIINAKNHLEEASIIQKAGQLGAITISTNMAGRGVNIPIAEKANDLGGLFVIGFERYVNSRIDNQLAGRTARQGQPGVVLFLLSNEDELLKKSPNIELFNNKDFTKLSFSISKYIKKEQKRNESNDFYLRKQLVLYNKIIFKQQLLLFNIRHEILMLDYEEISMVLLNKTLAYLSDIEKEINSDTLFYEKYFNTQVYQLKEQLLNVFEKNEYVLFDLKNIFLSVINQEWMEYSRLIEDKGYGLHLLGDSLSEFNSFATSQYDLMLVAIKAKIIKNILNYQNKKENLTFQNSHHKELIMEYISGLNSFKQNLLNLDFKVNDIIENICSSVLLLFKKYDKTIDIIEKYLDLFTNIELPAEFHNESDINVLLNKINSYHKKQIFYNINKCNRDDKEQKILISSLYSDIIEKNIEIFVNYLEKYKENNTAENNTQLFDIQNLYFYIHENINLNVFEKLIYTKQTTYKEYN